MSRVHAAVCSASPRGGRVCRGWCWELVVARFCYSWCCSWSPIFLIGVALLLLTASCCGRTITTTTSASRRLGSWPVASGDGRADVLMRLSGPNRRRIETTNEENRPGHRIYEDYDDDNNDDDGDIDDESNVRSKEGEQDQPEVEEDGPQPVTEREATPRYYVDTAYVKTIAILIGLLPVCCCLGVCCGCGIFYHLSILRSEVEEERRLHEGKSAVLKVVTARDLSSSHLYYNPATTIRTTDDGGYGAGSGGDDIVETSTSLTSDSSSSSSTLPGDENEPPLEHYRRHHHVMT